MAGEASSRNGKALDSCLIVVFGANGDLTRRKLVPAFFHLKRRGLLPKQYAFVGNSRSPMDHEDFRRKLATESTSFVADDIKDDGKRDWEEYLEQWYYVSGDMQDGKMYQELKAFLTQLEREKGVAGNYLFYLATAPKFFLPVVKHIDEVGLAKAKGKKWRRFVFEKPFGEDLASAQALNRDLSETLAENQIFRIDHYLGKETVQNIMVMRFANGIFEPIWNRNFIDAVEITVAETVGLEKRGDYYDKAGALRDMVPNHLFQLLSLIGMEPPASFAADAVRDEKTKVLQSIRPLTVEAVREDVLRAQYGAGRIDGKDVPAYRDEEGVAVGSRTETFVAMTLWLDNWRWAGVPFMLKTGKRLAAKTSEIRIRFRCAPTRIFQGTSCDALNANQLLIGIQPQEVICLRFGAKTPGPAMLVQTVSMEFDYSHSFGARTLTGYETLLYDVMRNDATLFMRADQIEWAWRVVDPILRAWAEDQQSPLPHYSAGSWGLSWDGEVLEGPHIPPKI